MTDPFSILGVGEDAGDDEIKQRYLALVRAFPPDRDPERFQVYRAAYEALRDERKRLESKLLATNEVALTRLKLACLPLATAPARASRASIRALLIEGIERVVSSSAAPRGQSHD